MIKTLLFEILVKLIEPSMQPFFHFYQRIMKQFWFTKIPGIFQYPKIYSIFVDNISIFNLWPLNAIYFQKCIDIIWIFHQRILKPDNISLKNSFHIKNHSCINFLHISWKQSVISINFIFAAFFNLLRQLVV